jgi:hypothetical protein
MNIPQLRSSVLKIKKRMDSGPAVTGVSHLRATVYRLTDLVEDMINAMEENEKGKLVSEVSVAGETFRTYVTNKNLTKRQRAVNSLIKHAESLDW